MKKLSDNAYNVYSQFGEDGIIESLFDLIGTTSKVCIEFGAWDGLHLSNTANLWKNGWGAILIEADPQKHLSLLKNVDGYNCIALNEFVGSEGEHTLENILRENEIDLYEQIDFMSIDIDGDDYYVFQSFSTSFRPRVVSCEYNPTIPPQFEIVPQCGNYFGCSALSLVKLAGEKGYSLVAMTETNCFFVVEEEFSKFAEFETRLDHLFISKHIAYLMSGYDGSYILSQRPTYGFCKPAQIDIHGQYFIPTQCKRRVIAALANTFLKGQDR